VNGGVVIGGKVGKKPLGWTIEGGTIGVFVTGGVIRTCMTGGGTTGGTGRGPARVVQAASAPITRKSPGDEVGWFMSANEPPCYFQNGYGRQSLHTVDSVRFLARKQAGYKS
jgi:hypothetical protein